MKDSKGRGYDGWCLRYPEDWGRHLAKYTFATTRKALWDEWLEGREGNREQEIQRYRRMGFRAVKVRIEEVA